MVLKTPLWMQASGGDPTISYSALDMRALWPAMFHDEGVQDTVFGSFKVTQRGAGANFSVDVAAGRAWIFGDDTSNQGMYMVESTAVVNLTVPSPPGSGTRVHRVVARVKDKLHNGTYTTYELTLEVLQDTGSGTPATPASAISLATVSVSTGQASVLNANIVDTRTQACTITSKYPLVGGDSSRPPNPFESELVWRTDSHMYEVWTGSAWRVMVPVPGPDQFLRKPSDTTRNNTATLTADPHMTVSLAANATYLVEALLVYQGASTASDFVFSWSSPSGSTLVWTPLGLTPADADQAPTQQAGYIRMPWTLGSTSRAIGTQTATPLVATPRGIITTSSSAGSLTLNWAQNTATAENTTLFNTSYLYARRVA